MKIAFILGAFPSLSETFILNQITGLLDLKYSVKIFANKEGDKSELHSEVMQYELLEDTTYLLQEMPLNKLLRYLKGAWYIFNNIANLPILLRTLNVIKFKKQALNLNLFYGMAALLSNERNNFDIVHAQFGTKGIYTMMLREFGVLHGKFVVSIRGSDICCKVEERKRNYADLFKTVDLMLPVSDCFKERLINLGCDESKIIVHRSGINLNKFSYKPRTYNSGDLIELVTVGRLEEKKGIEYGLKAFKMILETNGNLKYRIVGDGSLMPYLQELSAKLEIKDRVIFYGKKNHDEVVRILNDSHIFIAPSVTAVNGDQEGIPNVLKEAMATGMPVISTYHSGIPELVEDGVSGFLVEERNELDLARRIETLVNKPEVWSYMGKKGREIVEKFYDSDKLNRDLEIIYSKLLY